MCGGGGPREEPGFLSEGRWDRQGGSGRKCSILGCWRGRTCDRHGAVGPGNEARMEWAPTEESVGLGSCWAGETEGLPSIAVGG